MNIYRLFRALAFAAIFLNGAASAQQPSKTFQDCSDCPIMVVLPAGSFTMGWPSSEKSKPYWKQRRVTISKPFAVGKYEVTFVEWDACVSAGGCRHRPIDLGWGRGRRPAIHVSWADAQEYVDWLSRRTGKRYRLLSESEWEYAARAGTRTRYFWGDAVGRDRANCDGCGSRWDGAQTAPAGSFAANGFGLHDLRGNVWEWVDDCWHESYDGAPTDSRAWTAGGDCDKRVLRGGSWLDSPWNLRAAVRIWGTTGIRRRWAGFRVALMISP